MSLYCHRGVQTPASCPFFLNDDGSCLYFNPDLAQMESISLSALLPSNNPSMRRMVHGRFEGANQSDFSDAKQFYSIKEVRGAFYHTVEISQPAKYRYIRYCSPDNGFGNVAELKFYNKNGDKLNGTVIGTPGSWSGSNMTVDKVFDDDVSTFFDAPIANNAWVGLDLGEAADIGKLSFLPRTDRNGIYEGHVYELFFWNGNEYQSLGRKTADSHILQYEVPNTSLLILKNVTINRMGNKPFTIENGAQQWFQ
jgi:hypothetical protein